MMRVLIAGAGVVGTVYGAHLGAAGHAGRYDLILVTVRADQLVPACARLTGLADPFSWISPWTAHDEAGPAQGGRTSPRTAGAVGGPHRADIAFALVGSPVGTRGQGEHSAHSGDRWISLAGHPSGQARKGYPSVAGVRGMLALPDGY